MRPAPSERLGRVGRVGLLLVPLASLGACLAIAGYDGKTAGPADGAASNTPTEASSTGGDPPDGIPPDGGGTPVPDAGPRALDNCTALDGSCPPEQPHCSIYYDAGSAMHAYACLSSDEQDGAPGYEMRCGPAPKECGEGLGCGYSWSTGYHCTNVCRSDAECRGARPFCNHPLTLPPTLGPLRLCETCDPTRTDECLGSGQGCLIRGLATDPSCGAIAPTAGSYEAPCSKATECQSGLVCVCNNGQALGDDCALTPGVCRQACFNRGVACPAVAGQPTRTCTAAGTQGLYAYCKP
jgi:hypothetical protein